MFHLLGVVLSLPKDKRRRDEMAKITIDKDLCTGCGLCASSCPDVFKIEDDNLAHVTADACKSCDLKEVAEQCPVSAITVK